MNSFTNQRSTMRSSTALLSGRQKRSNCTTRLHCSGGPPSRSIGETNPESQHEQPYCHNMSSLRASQETRKNGSRWHEERCHTEIAVPEPPARRKHLRNLQAVSNWAAGIYAAAAAPCFRFQLGRRAALRRLRLSFCASFFASRQAALWQYTRSCSASQWHFAAWPQIFCP